jgi:hypothetical protein
MSSLAATVFAWYVIPRHTIPHSKLPNRIRRLDLPGIALYVYNNWTIQLRPVRMLVSILLLNISLTFGASYGWSHASFFAPLIISAILFPVFFFWESRVPVEYALIPPSIWKIPNFSVLIVYSLFLLGWWGTNFLPYVQLFNQVHGEGLILASVRVVPEGIIAGIVSVIMV